MTTPTSQASQRKDPVLLILRYGGMGLLAGIGGIHLNLWITGYRHIPTIGPLFLLQVIASFVLAAAIAFTGRWYVAAAGALFAIGTFVAYEVFRATTIFGFHEIRTTKGFTAGVLEALAFVALGGYALLVYQRGSDSRAAAPADRKIGSSAARLGIAGGLLAIILVAVVGVTAVPSHTTKASNTNTVQAGATIKIQNFVFSPKTLTVTPGEVVKVVNEDAVAHTVTATPGSNPQGHFDTGDIGTGGGVATFVAPRQPGKYSYNCTIHTFMVGFLVVS